MSFNTVYNVDNPDDQYVSGVYILETKGPEYRVSASTKGINGFIAGQENSEKGAWTPNVDEIYDHFFDKTIYTDYDMALNEAIAIAEKISFDKSGESDYNDILDDGIFHIRLFRNLNFVEM